MAIALSLIVGALGGAVSVVAMRVMDGPSVSVVAADSHVPGRPGSGSVGSSTSTRDTSAIPSSEGPSAAALRVVNQRGGYVFMRPAEWNVTTNGARTELRSPGGNVLFSFGPAPDGALPDAATAAINRYSPDLVEMNIVSSYEETTQQGLRTWVVGGTGEGSEGRIDRFLAVSVEAPGGNRAIIVRFASGPVVLDVLPDIRRVISSYRVWH